jgi:hypothetical protein
MFFQNKSTFGDEPPRSNYSKGFDERFLHLGHRSWPGNLCLPCRENNLQVPIPSDFIGHFVAANKKKQLTINRKNRTSLRVFVVSRIVNCIVYSSCKVIYSLGECMYHMMNALLNSKKQTNANKL